MSDTAQAVHAGDVGERGAGGTRGGGEREAGERRVNAGTAASGAQPDPLTTLREYRSLAPWGLRDLAALAGGILDASGVIPVNAAARAQPSERTIRFYVGRGLVSPPEGRGTAAVYSYRHLLQVLAIKLRQMEGATLDSMTREFSELTGISSSAASRRRSAPGCRVPIGCGCCRLRAPGAAAWVERCSVGSPRWRVSGRAPPAGV